MTALDFAGQAKAVDRIQHSLLWTLSHGVWDSEFGRFVLRLVVLANVIVTSHNVISGQVFAFYFIIRIISNT